jgi:hypothetical protein
MSSGVVGAQGTHSMAESPAVYCLHYRGHSVNLLRVQLLVYLLSTNWLKAWLIWFLRQRVLQRQWIARNGVFAVSLATRWCDTQSPMQPHHQSFPWLFGRYRETIDLQCPRLDSRSHFLTQKYVDSQVCCLKNSRFPSESAPHRSHSSASAPAKIRTFCISSCKT